MACTYRIEANMLLRSKIERIARNRTTGFALVVTAVLVAMAAQARSFQSHQKHPEPTEKAALHGVVTNLDRRPLAGATVSLQAKNEQPLTVLSDASGSYHFSTASPGIYILHVEIAGCRATTVDSVTLGDEESKQLDLTLDCSKAKPQESSAIPEFFDDPHFTVAGVTDTTTLGGHGSDATARSRDALAKDTAALREPSAGDHPHSDLPDSNPPDSNRPDSNNADAIAEQHHLLADAAEKQGKPLEAVREYQRAAELDPNEANVFDWGAELLLHHAAEPAIEVFSKGTRLFPHSVRMLTGLGAAWYAQGFYDRAAQSLCEASDLDPSDPEPYLFMGKMQAVEEVQSDAVAERLARFVRLEPENALANYYGAVSLWKQWRSSEDVAQLARVKALLAKSIHLDPKLGVAYVQLGILYAEQKDLPHAISAYRQAMEVAPQLEQAHYRLAQAYRQMGENSKAQMELQLYQQITKEKADETARERHEVQQFVYQLQDRTPATQPQ
jgi:tetratricopeptide (TPR) repeat protein